MNFSNHRHYGEPLYIVIVKTDSARTWLTKWTGTSRSINARIEDNRMHIFDHNTLSMFIVTWPHSWDSVLIWDPWSKRHITV
jgi:hypothetical protein